MGPPRATSDLRFHELLYEVLGRQGLTRSTSDHLFPPVARPGFEDVLVEIGYVGLCGSDLGMYRGTFAIGTYPSIPGHEVSGTVVATGDDVPESIAVGERVTFWPYTECGVCPACRAGRP